MRASCPLTLRRSRRPTSPTAFRNGDPSFHGRAMTTPVLQLHDIHKTFPNGTVALRGVNLAIQAGKVHGLLGANGAGKSTLIKILSGALRATSGALSWHGPPVAGLNPADARLAGRATIHQHIPLVPSLSVRENVFLGQGRLWRNAGDEQAQFDA